MSMHDWRGTRFPDNEPLTYIELAGQPVVCAVCGKTPLRAECHADGDPGRTHWHGGKHTKNHAIQWYCGEHMPTEAFPDGVDSPYNRL